MPKTNKPKTPTVEADAILSFPERQTLADVFATLQLPACDLLMIGDGSGNMWHRPCGWSGVLVDMQNGGRRLFHGAMNYGSIEFAELMPYLQALAWHSRHHRDASRLYRVTLVTDSKLLVHHANELLAADGQPPRTLPLPYLMLRGAWELGYRIAPVWYRRTNLQLNVLSDLIAGLSRRAIMSQLPVGEDSFAAKVATALAAVRVVHDGGTLNIYDINP